MTRRGVTLDDKYDLERERVFLSGTQAIVRVALMQKARDRAAGLNTAGFISGYRGSPLGGLDLQLWRAGELLKANDIVFQPGLNEDLAATSIWGTQQAELRGEGRYDGVFSIWYGKGPGVDRSGDALRHANFDGTSPKGGVIALMGDDHTCESSTTAHQSEFAFVDAMIPILNPAGIQDLVDYGLIGWAMSRFAGTWVGIKCVKDTVESTGVIDSAPGRARTVIPDFVMPPNGLNIRPAGAALNRHALENEELLHRWRKPAVLAFLRENKLDRIAMGGGLKPRLGIVSLGKSWLDTLGALDLLGIDEVRAANLGLRLYKVAAPWPLEPDGVNRFADGLETILVVEEKRSLVETQLKEQLYGRSDAPVVVGKKDMTGNVLLPAWGALDSTEVAVVIARCILGYADDSEIAARLKHLEHAEAMLKSGEEIGRRIPHFCSGCPHSTSTQVPEGSRAYAGIGCHTMALWMDRRTEGFTQMGGEGANWIGEAPFSKRDHVFQNIGDGTWGHSGTLAMRAAAAAGVNITYKVLFNDAVAMTGGQPVEGHMTVDQVARQAAAEGAKKIAIVTDDPHKYPASALWPEGATIHHRSDLEEVQLALREVKGLSVLIYDQTCAAEKRRRRKRGQMPDPDKRVVINALVCEGCGDCGVKSNCVSIQPLETEFGRKRRIDQSSCNKDYSCLEGFCPSFVTVHGGKLKQGKAIAAPSTLLPAPEPTIELPERTRTILITGVGGTGIVTAGQVIGMAAHLDGLGVGIIDMSGLAQKGGAVSIHMRIGPTPESIHAIRVGPEEADVVLGCDIVVTGSKRALAAIRPGESQVFVNLHETYPGDFTRNADFSLPTRRIRRAIEERAGATHAHFFEAERMAQTLLGDPIATNMMMVGFAWQKGQIPIRRESMLEAIRLNGVGVEMNRAAFEWGRRAAFDLAGTEEEAGVVPEASPPSLEDIVARRVAFLTDYKSRRYAARYRKRVEKITAAEDHVARGATALATEVAHALFKLMAIKDEYEVARLFADGSFEKQLRQEFASWNKIEFHLAPPLTARRDKHGHLKKKTYGPGMTRVFRLLARLKFLRGTPFDPFGRTKERRWERKLLRDYLALLNMLEKKLTADNYETARALAAYPEKIRGFGHVKEAQARQALAERERLMAEFPEPNRPQLAEAAE